MNTTIHLIRHAEVEARYQGIFGGRIDMNLSPRGELQARALADYLPARKCDTIYASPMKRVQQTLAPARAAMLRPPITLSDLYEVDFGAWTGLTFAEVKARFDQDAHHWLRQLDAGAIPDAENITRYRQRIDACLQEILRNNPGKAVGVFCHGGVIRMLLALLLELPFAEMDRFEIEYASISTVVIKPDRARLQLLDFSPWRDLPT